MSKPNLTKRVIAKAKTIPPKTAAPILAAAGALVLAGVLWRRRLSRSKS